MSRRIRPVILSAAQELFLRALTLLMQHRALSRVVTADANPARSRGGRSAFLRCPFRGTARPYLMGNLMAAPSAPTPTRHPRPLRLPLRHVPAETPQRRYCRKPAAPAPTDERLRLTWPPGRCPPRQKVAGSRFWPRPTTPPLPDQAHRPPTRPHDRPPPAPMETSWKNLAPAMRSPDAPTHRASSGSMSSESATTGAVLRPHPSHPARHSPRRVRSIGPSLHRRSPIP